ncbi:MAG: DUF559 domain-containing protein [Pirellulaceae bacterium]
MPPRQNPKLTKHARELRARQTEAEHLMWSALRNRAFCGLKFRRQKPIEPYIADFACIEKMLIVEIDGGYHDMIYDNDMTREKHLRSLGWDVIRFRNEDVIADVEAVTIAMAKHLKIELTYKGKKPC